MEQRSAGASRAAMARIEHGQTRSLVTRNLRDMSPRVPTRQASGSLLSGSCQEGEKPPERPTRQHTLDHEDWLDAPILDDHSIATPPPIASILVPRDSGRWSSAVSSLPQPEDDSTLVSYEGAAKGGKQNNGVAGLKTMSEQPEEEIPWEQVAIGVVVQSENAKVGEANVASSAPQHAQREQDVPVEPSSRGTASLSTLTEPSLSRHHRKVRSADPGSMVPPSAPLSPKAPSMKTSSEESSLLQAKEGPHSRPIDLARSLHTPMSLKGGLNRSSHGYPMPPSHHMSFISEPGYRYKEQENSHRIEHDPLQRPLQSPHPERQGLPSDVPLTTVEHVAQTGNMGFQSNPMNSLTDQMSQAHLGPSQARYPEFYSQNQSQMPPAGSYDPQTVSPYPSHAAPGYAHGAYHQQMPYDPYMTPHSQRTPYGAPYDFNAPPPAPMYHPDSGSHEVTPRMMNPARVSTTLEPSSQKVAAAAARPAAPPRTPSLPSGGIQIDIGQGKQMELRGATETWEAIGEGRITITNCIFCQIELNCLDDALMVICPDCTMISPVDQAGGDLDSQSGRHGVGVGVKPEEVIKWLQETMG